jgi:hypothetical protein
MSARPASPSATPHIGGAARVDRSGINHDWWRGKGFDEYSTQQTAVLSFPPFRGFLITAVAEGTRALFAINAGANSRTEHRRPRPPRTSAADTEPATMPGNRRACNARPAKPHPFIKCDSRRNSRGVNGTNHEPLITGTRCGGSCREKHSYLPLGRRWRHE